jgi:hypothetical protein
MERHCSAFVLPMELPSVVCDCIYTYFRKETEPHVPQRVGIDGHAHHGFARIRLFRNTVRVHNFVEETHNVISGASGRGAESSREMAHSSSTALLAAVAQ